MQQRWRQGGAASTFVKVNIFWWKYFSVEISFHVFLWHLYTFVNLELIIMQDKMMLQSDFSVLETEKFTPPPPKKKAKTCGTQRITPNIRNKINRIKGGKYTVAGLAQCECAEEPQPPDGKSVKLPCRWNTHPLHFKKYFKKGNIEFKI